MNEKQNCSCERRDFLKTAAVAAATFTVLPAHTVFGLDANNKVEIGITGCGGRGTWIGRLFQRPYRPGARNVWHGRGALP